jgi:hypothetical protein
MSGADELEALKEVYDDPVAIHSTVMTCDPRVVAELTQRQVRGRSKRKGRRRRRRRGRRRRRRRRRGEGAVVGGCSSTTRRAGGRGGRRAAAVVSGSSKSCEGLSSLPAAHMLSFLAPTCSSPSAILWCALLLAPGCNPG